MVHREGTQRGGIKNSRKGAVKTNSFSGPFHRKGIGAVVAIGLLLIVAVGAVVGFQSWFQDFSSGTFSDVEQKSAQGSGNSGIETVVGNDLYFKNGFSENITINSVKIGDNDCGINGSYDAGIKTLSLGNNCTQNLSTSTPDVIVKTDKGVFVKKIYLKNAVVSSDGGSQSLSSCTLDGQVVNDGENHTFYKYDKPYNNLDGCTVISQIRTCTDGTLDGSTEYDTASCNDSLAPTQGGEWVLAFGNGVLGTNDFYVMKYEAKDVSGIATSQAASTPWVSIPQTDAITECNSLDGVDSGDYHLITNNEWMTIARDIETIADNWADGVIGSAVGSGGLKRGNVGIDDSASYNGADPEFGTGRNTLALLNLTTGEGIWDLSGNVWEWNSDTIDCSGGYPCVNMPYDSTPGSEWIELTAIDTYGSLSYDLTSPTNNTWNSLYGMGQMYTDSNTASDGGTTHAFLRGGTWLIGAGAGAFALYLDVGPSNSNSFIGFRCSYAP